MPTNYTQTSENSHFHIHDIFTNNTIRPYMTFVNARNLNSSNLPLNFGCDIVRFFQSFPLPPHLHSHSRELPGCPSWMPQDENSLHIIMIFVHKRERDNLKSGEGGNCLGKWRGVWTGKKKKHPPRHIFSQS